MHAMQHSTTLEALGARMEAQRQPMDALSREMEAASEPMKRIGKEMEAMGARVEREANLADGRVRQLIDQAYHSGKAQPAPVQPSWRRTESGRPGRDRRRGARRSVVENIRLRGYSVDVTSPPCARSNSAALSRWSAENACTTTVQLPSSIAWRVA